ncbi:hypothetical protein L3Y34_010457 [Caenorhabditis briggsae]|uniref:AGC-kinase C-terminal domain-containing protein n=1 Tax=Caenorhabditis briggsae TaxID=6238 RepID=A0AAE8ZME1_CAEBR|nr:hypothetical protein L3Y34_010457 [Caenorhabditis briggsae]
MEQKVQEQLQRLSTSPAKPVGVKDFQFLKVVGIGGYGKVYQVREKSGNHVYALKIIRKTERPIDAKHLQDEIRKRMGLEELKTTAFFRGTDWQKMKEQGYLPPYIPSVLNDEDVSNFEPCFTDMPAEESPVKKPSEKVKKTITENVFAGFDSVAQSTSKLGKASKRIFQACVQKFNK